MFAIYNNGSVQFRSTSDNLYELDTVDKSAESRHKPDDERYDSFGEFLDKENKDNETDRENAIKSYKSIANIDINEVIYHVSDIMTKNCISVDSNSTVIDAYNILKENKVSQIPIVTFGDKIIGMIDKKIILNLLLDDFNDAKITMIKKLSDIYLPELITTDPLPDIRRVSKVMINYKIDAIPVVNQQNRLVGIVSKTDIIKAVSHIPELKLWA